jgi:SOUL heme-binding protein
MTEKQQFALVQDFGDFEVRRYAPHVLMQVEVHGDFMSAGNAAFGPLVSYISGRNESGKKFAMTAPVIQEPSAANRHLVSFVLPAGTKAEDAPKPANAAVSTIDVDEKLVAVRKFGGSWNEQRFMAEGEILRNAVIQQGLTPVGNIYWARFDPPWKPGFLKRNEALLNLTKDK